MIPQQVAVFKDVCNVFPDTAETHHMETSQKRVIGSLILLLGVSFFVIGLQSDQANTVLTIVKQVFEAAVAGAP